MTMPPITACTPPGGRPSSRHQVLRPFARTSAVAATVVAALLAVLLSLAQPARALAESEDPVDRDADRIEGVLEQRLERLAPAKELKILVMLRRSASSKRLLDLRRRVPGVAVRRRFSVVDAVAASATSSEIRALADLPDVARVELDAPVRALNDSPRDSFGVSAAQLQVPQLEGDGDGDRQTYSPRDLIAAVIDTGIDSAHPDLDAGKVLGSVDCVSGSCGASSSGSDEHGHGTHVAATVAGSGEGDAQYTGVAPGAGLVDVRALDATGAGRASGVIASVEWVVDHADEFGIEAINLSLAGAGCSDGKDAQSQAVNVAVEAGLVVVTAAGNSGPATCTVASPAAAESGLTVANMADLGVGGFFLSPTSSRGPTADGRIKPDVAAPGVNITSAKANTGSYRSLSGTSMATPFVTGLALLMLEVDPTLGPERLKQKVMETAIDWGAGGEATVAGTSGRDVDYGAGRLDAYAALRATRAGGLISPPPVPAHRRYEGIITAEGDRVGYRLEVNGLDPIAATLIVPGATQSASGADFDLELRDPTGAVVVRGESQLREDHLSHRPEKSGPYSLTVVARRGAGAFFLDVSAPLDETPPETSILSGPRPATTVRSARFAISSSEPRSTFECSLDGAAFSACSASHAYSQVEDGTHTFRARARDGAGNLDATEAIRTWRVDTRRPRVTRVGPAGGASAVAASTDLTATFSEAMKKSTLDRATVTLKRRGSATAVLTAFRVTSPERIRVDPHRRLRPGATYVARVTTGATDLAGNRLDQSRRLPRKQEKRWRFTVRD